MILAFASTLGLFAQAAALVTTPAPKAAPIRVWIADSTVYVSLRDPGYLTVLHVDPVGRIRVLFPLSPDINAAVPSGATFELGVLVDGERGTGTILAARSSRPFQAAGLSTGSFWDYDHAWLFQPTAGNPLAALLDIADRMTDGLPYDFDVATYRTGGTLAAQDPQLMPPVCLGCVRNHPVEQQSTVIIDQSNSVDCSSAVLVNSFCGVVDNRVTNTYVYNEAAPVTEPVYIPYYVPIFVPRRRRVSPPPPPPQRTLANAFTLRRASGVVAPPQPRRKPVIHVEQPRQRYAPIEPRRREEPDGGSAPPAAMPRVKATSAPVPVAPAMPRSVTWVSTGMPVRASMLGEQPRAQVPERHPTTMSVPRIQPRALVPSSGLLRTVRSRPH
jgi:hypothetical protein